MRSILHNEDDGTCLLCMALRCDFSRKHFLEEHHAIYGWGRRCLAEKYGLKVYLCREHHRGSAESIHDNTYGSQIYSKYVKEYAQIRFEEAYPEINFVQVFGKNYKTDRPNPIVRKEARSIPVWQGIEWIEEDADIDES